VTRFLFRRLIQTVFVLIFVSILVFLIMRILPGDPALLSFSEEQLRSLTPEILQQTRHELGLDRPLAVQYFTWVNGLLHADFGTSIMYHSPVWNEVAQRMPVTMYLGLWAFIMSIIIGIPLGIIAAIRRGKWEDTVSTVLANIGITVPSFWLGVLMIWAFGLHLKWLPTFGYTSPFDNFFLSTTQAIMPVFCLTVFAAGSTARQTRSAILEVIQQDYVRTAWAKGLTERTVILVHVLKNSLIPVVTLKGMSIRNIVGGAVLVETVFSIPGMGRLAVDAMMAKDYPIVQGVFLIIALVVCMANLLVDVIYGWLDPRIRYS
jgi:peptide/nickel transport system permease protein